MPTPRHLIGLTLLAALLCACPAPTLPSTDLRWPHGERAVATDDLALVEQQPGDPAPIDVHATFLGSPGFALPAGTVVVRTPADDPDASRTQSPTVDPATNVWIRVKVLDSPVPELVGRAGWVFGPGLTLLPPGTAPDPAAARAVTNQPLTQPGRLCDAPGPNATCGFDVGPGMFVKLGACSGTYARLGVWAPGGAYVEGFLPGDQLSPDPCAP